MSFSLQPVWPPGFVSRLCTRGDPLCMLRVGNEQACSHAPSPNSVEKLSKATGGRGTFRPIGTMKKPGAVSSDA